MSLGSSYGTDFDTSAVASNNAALAGVIVVASAGNSGDTHYITGSPATGTNVISVASSQDDGNINMYSKFQVKSPSDIAFYPMVEAGFGPTLSGEITADLGYSSSNSQGCNAFSENEFQKKIALISRGTCTFVTKVKNAQNAGASAVLIYNNVATAPFEMGGSDSDIKIPSAMIFKSDGELLVSKLSSGAVNVTLSDAWHLAMRFDPGADPSLVDLPSAFTSRGPRRIDSFPKPDISAPGDTIYSVMALSGKYGTSMSGTSMAAPHMTGVMALMRQWKPGWSVAELKAGVMNTANYDITPSTTKYAPQRVGAGRVDVSDALANDVIMYSSDDPGGVSVSFGAPEISATTGPSIAPPFATKIITVQSKSIAETYTPSLIERTSIPYVSFALLDMDDNPLTSVSVPAGGITQFKL
ncbi:MAG: S8 family serine peptidase, partial [Anaerolineales bacterium]